MAAPRFPERDHRPSAGWTDAEVARALRSLIARTQYERGLSAEARAILRTAFTDIAGQLTALDGTPAGAQLANRARLASLLADFDGKLQRAYSHVQRHTLRELGGLAKVEADAARVDMAVTISEHLTTPAPAAEAALAGNAFVSRARLESIATLPIQGKTLGQWWATEARDMTAATRGAIQQGLVTGTPLRDIAKRIVPPKGSVEPAVYRQAAARAQAIVRTAATAVHADSALTSYEEAGDGISEAYEWLSTRDNRTTPICIALDGRQFRYKDPKRRVPPAHVNCRSTVIPVMDWQALGIPAPGPRDPLGFPSLAGWLRQQSPAYQASVLGKQRAEWFREGRLDLRDLIDGDGRTRTLAQLRDVLAPAPQTDTPVRAAPPAVADAPRRAAVPEYADLQPPAPTGSASQDIAQYARYEARQQYRERTADHVLGEVQALGADTAAERRTLAADLQTARAEQRKWEDALLAEGKVWPTLPEGSAERSASLQRAFDASDRSKAAKALADTLDARHGELTRTLTAKAHEVLAVNHPAEIKATTEHADLASESLRERWARGHAFVQRITSRAALPDGMTITAELHPYSGGAYQLANRVHVYEDTRAGVIPHEIAHAIEERQRGILGSSIKWRNARAVSTQAESLYAVTGNEAYTAAQYADAKALRLRNWHPNHSAYVGRIYKDAGGEYGTEVLSMGVEYLHDDPVGFAERDPDFFRYVVRALRGDLDTEVVDSPSYN